MSVSQLLEQVRKLSPGQAVTRMVRGRNQPSLYRGKLLPVRLAKRRWQQQLPTPSTLKPGGTATYFSESGPVSNWPGTGNSPAWCAALHSFSELPNPAVSQDSQAGLIESWLSQNPPAQGPGWEVAPLSARITHWVKWLLSGNPAPAGMHESLIQQAHVLSQQVEHHHPGPRLFANARALVFAGTCFEGAPAERWANQGLKLIAEQLDSQLLKDGASIELSPMYHALTLVDILDLVHLGQLFPGSDVAVQAAEYRGCALAMANWLEGMLHGDGDIPFFNDTALGVAPPPSAILAYAHSLGVVRPVADGAANHFDASGYIAVRDGGQVVLIDVAAVGPDRLPSTAHADSLSFEWSLLGQRVLVNSGTFSLWGDKAQLALRRTAAHNTVVVDGVDSSEVLTGLSPAKTAQISALQLGQAGTCTVVKAQHNGYMRLKGRVMHQREWRVMPGVLQVRDTLSGKYTEACARYHLHPDVTVRANPQGLELHWNGGPRCRVLVRGGELAVEAGHWHPRLGESQPNQILVMRFTEPVLETQFCY